LRSFRWLPDDRRRRLDRRQELRLVVLDGDHAVAATSNDRLDDLLLTPIGRSIVISVRSRSLGCGWQKEIVKPIVAGGGDCVIAVKTTAEAPGGDPDALLRSSGRPPERPQPRYHETHEDGHGRIDDRFIISRRSRVISLPEGLAVVKAIGYTVRITRHGDVARRTRCVIISAVGISAASGSRSECVGTGDRVDALGAGREFPRG